MTRAKCSSTPLSPKLRDQLFEHRPRGGIEVGDGAGVDEYLAHRWRLLAYQGAHRLAEPARVGEEQLAVDAQDDQAGEGLVLGVILHAAVAQGLVVDCPGGPSQDRALRPVGAEDQRQQGDDHGDEQADEDTEQEDARKADQRQQEVAAVDASQAAQRLDVDEVGDGGDHDRSEDRFGQVVEQRHEQQHRHDQEDEEDDVGELRLDAGRVRPRGA